MMNLLKEKQYVQVKKYQKIKFFQIQIKKKVYVVVLLVMKMIKMTNKNILLKKKMKILGVLVK